MNFEKEFHVSWLIVLYKFTLGLIETVSGITIALFGRQIFKLYTIDLAKELSEDPHDMLAKISNAIVPHIFTHNTYIIIYLILLGAVKIAGAIGLIYKQNWGVDLLVGLTLILLPVQIVTLILHPAIFDFMYMSVGLLIALYLIEFKPKAWISRMFLR
jgi:uncharacterized membrane protein